jgi:hypothetical protein
MKARHLNNTTHVPAIGSPTPTPTDRLVLHDPPTPPTQGKARSQLPSLGLPSHILFRSNESVDAPDYDSILDLGPRFPTPQADSGTENGSLLEDIGVFQQSSVFSEASRVSAGPAQAELLSLSTNDTFDSNFSDSTTPQSSRGLHLDSNDALMPPVPRPRDTQHADSSIPAIMSQDPTIAASWRNLFAKAPRPPTNLPDPSAAGPKYFQEYLTVNS